MAGVILRFSLINQKMLNAINLFDALLKHVLLESVLKDLARPLYRPAASRKKPRLQLPYDCLPKQKLFRVFFYVSACNLELFQIRLGGHSFKLGIYRAKAGMCSHDNLFPRHSKQRPSGHRYLRHNGSYVRAIQIMEIVNQRFCGTHVTARGMQY